MNEPIKAFMVLKDKKLLSLPLFFIIDVTSKTD
jgi:hypothetical protein